MIVAGSLSLGVRAADASPNYRAVLNAAESRLKSVPQTHAISPAARPIVDAAIAQLLRPSHRAITQGAPLSSLKTRVSNGRLRARATYQVGPGSDLSTQLLTVSLKTGKGSIRSEVFEGGGKPDTVEVKQLGK